MIRKSYSTTAMSSAEDVGMRGKEGELVYPRKQSFEGAITSLDNRAVSSSISKIPYSNYLVFIDTGRGGGGHDGGI